MEDREIIECLGQKARRDVVLAHLNLPRIDATPPVHSRKPQNALDDRLRNRHVLQMQESESLPERLRLVIPLNSQTLLSVDPAEA